MKIYGKLLAVIYRNVVKWLDRAGDVLVARQPVDDVVAQIDEAIKLMTSENPTIAIIAKFYNIVASLYDSLPRVVDQLSDPNTIRAATVGKSSSDELAFRTASGEISANVAEFMRIDLRAQIIGENVAQDDAAKYLQTTDAMTLFDIVLAGTVQLAPIERGMLARRTERAKDVALGAKTPDFDELLARFSPETAYTGEKDLANTISPGATSFAELSCIVIIRSIGSAMYHKPLKSTRGKFEGINNAFLRDTETIVPSEFTGDVPPSVTVHGNAPWFVIDSIDGRLFAQVSRNGIRQFDEMPVAPDRPAAYHATVEPIILAAATSPEAKLIASRYANASFTTGSDTALNHMDKVFIAPVASSRKEYLELATDDALIRKRLDRGENLSLIATIRRDRHINTFSRKLRKYIENTAPTDAEIEAHSSPQVLFNAAYQSAYAQVRKDIVREKLFSQASATLADFARNST